MLVLENIRLSIAPHVKRKSKRLSIPVTIFGAPSALPKFNSIARKRIYAPIIKPIVGIITVVLSGAS